MLSLPSPEHIDEILSRWVSTCIDTENIKKRLLSGKKLRIKFGIDPTGPIIHIGHAVPMLKLADFQKLGHTIIFIIGDATAQVGDTSDKEAERPMLTREETRKNTENWLQQFSKILDIDAIELRYNSDWMDTTNFNTVGELAKHFSVAQMLDRDNFAKRYNSGIRISLQEFLYPIMQGWDSVQIKADIELGGNDQYFNLLAGRTLQEGYQQEKQDIMTFHLIEGLDGRKMSKTYKNYIALSDTPNDMFVKIMQLKDELIVPYFTQCTRVSMQEIEIYKEQLQTGISPRDIKMKLAYAIVSLYYKQEDAKNAQAYFEKVLTGWEVPDEKDIPLTQITESELPIVTLIRQIGLVSNSTEARNAINSGGVKIDSRTITDPKEMLTIGSEKILIQVGKKKFRYIVRN